MIKSSALALIALCIAVPTVSAEPQASYGPELEGFDYPFTVHRFGFSSQGQNLSMAFMDSSRGSAERPYHRASARQEFLRCDLGGNHGGADRGRLPGNRSRSDRLLQVHQGRALPVQLPSARGEYARAARSPRGRARDR